MKNFKSNKKGKGTKSKGSKVREQSNRNGSYHKDDDRIESNAKLKNESPVGDPNWYFTDSDLAEQASRFSFQSFVGNGDLVDQATLPSILVYYLNPSLGGYIDSTNSTAAINLCARKLYAQMSSKSGRAASYAPQDVMTAILAMGEVISIASYIKRALGIAFTYSKRNRDLPIHMLTAMGINGNDLFKKLSTYRVEYNTVINLANQIAIPANITWFNKCDAIYQGIYADSPDEMAQLYLMVPATTWKINESSYPQGTVLETAEVCANLDGTTKNAQNLSVYINLLSEMIENLLVSGTLNLVYADIINYCEKEQVPMLHLGITDELYTVEPRYDEEVLLHIHNMSVLRFPAATHNNLEDAEEGLYTRYNDVVPSASFNNLVYMPIFRIPYTSDLSVGECSILEDLDIVDFPYGNPDLTQRIEATRFSARYTPELFRGEFISGDLCARLATVGDHYASHCRAFTNGVYVDVSFRSMQKPDSIGSALNLATHLEKFRHHHIVYFFDTGVSEDALSHITQISGDVNYFTKLGADWLERINSLCFQGLFELR